MATDNQTAGQTPRSLALSPATSLQDVYAAVGQALAEAAQNAVAAQQQCNVTIAAITTMGVSTLFSLDSAATGTASQEELGKAAAKARDKLTPGKAP
jgi:4-hydroxyphenylpyruvate dioxygenase-like putative hemolysin